MKFRLVIAVLAVIFFCTSCSGIENEVEEMFTELETQYNEFNICNEELLEKTDKEIFDSLEKVQSVFSDFDNKFAEIKEYSGSINTLLYDNKDKIKEEKYSEFTNELAKINKDVDEKYYDLSTKRCYSIISIIVTTKHSSSAEIEESINRLQSIEEYVDEASQGNNRTELLEDFKKANYILEDYLNYLNNAEEWLRLKNEWDEVYNGAENVEDLLIIIDSSKEIYGDLCELQNNVEEDVQNLKSVKSESIKENYSKMNDAIISLLKKTGEFAKLEAIENGNNSSSTESTKQSAWKISTSSYLVPNSPESGPYTAEMLRDNDFSTCWIPGDNRNGIGESITLTLSNGQKASFDSIEIYAGYGKSQAHYLTNLRAKDITVTIDGKTIGTVTLSDKMQWQTINLGKKYEGTKVKLTIESYYNSQSYNGKKAWNDLCISEISLDGIVIK